MSSSVAIQSEHDPDDIKTAAFLHAVNETFAETVASARAIFTTDATDNYHLYQVFTGMLPEHMRAEWDCRCCRRFVETYGGLVCIAADGATTPLFWNEARTPAPFKRAVATLRRTVASSLVQGVFVTPEKVWGTPQNYSEKWARQWSHLAVTPPRSLVWSGKVYGPHSPREAADQVAAKKRQAFGVICNALDRFKPEHVNDALRLFRSGSLPRAERFVGNAEFLANLHAARAAAHGARKDNVVWLAVADAPEGYLYPTSSVVGSLLEDLAAGYSFEKASEAFARKVDPRRYQRATEAPSVGNIEQAERLVAERGLAPALERRYATPADVMKMAIWRRRLVSEPASPAAATGIFRHLLPSAEGPRPVAAPAQVMSWSRFARTILPSAEAIEVSVPLQGHFIALTAPVDPDAPPLFKWDREEERNPFAWYVYPAGSFAGRWGLAPASWTAVTAVVPLPTMWGTRPSPYLSQGVVLMLDGARDIGEPGNNGLYQDILRDDLHEIRSTLWAYSQSRTLAGKEGPQAAGIDVRNGKPNDTLLRVLAGGGRSLVRIDRWD